MADLHGNLEQAQNTFSNLIANAEWLYNKGEYKRALDSYTKAQALKPDDKSCFVGRSKCYLKAGLYENALKEADASLTLDHKCVKALELKAEALYLMGEFEFALVFFQRGRELRPQVQAFRLGIQRAQEAIENSVGSTTSVKLKIKGDLSFFQKEERAEPLHAIQELTKERQQNIQKNMKTNKRVLGEFSSDIKLLETMLEDKDLAKSKTKNGEEIGAIIQDSLTFLLTCAEFWSQEKPIWALEHKHKSTKEKCTMLRSHTP